MSDNGGLYQGRSNGDEKCSDSMYFEGRNKTMYWQRRGIRDK